MAFVDALRIELGRDCHAGLAPLVGHDSIFSIDLLDGVKTLVVTCLSLTTNKAAIYSFEFDDQKIATHMEEDVGIVDPDGLLAYAAYFRDALALRPSLEPGSLEDELFFVLQYKIGTHVLEGRLPLRKVQGDLDATVFRSMIALYRTDATRKIAVGTRNTSQIRKLPVAAAGAPPATQAVEGEPGEEEHTAGDGAGAAGGANSAAMRAKKRRVGGVNIFPGMRKK